jgi:chorismate mutase
MSSSDPELSRFRGQIDELDAALIRTLAQRFACTRAVGEHKAKVGLPAADPAREAAQVARWRSLAEEAGLDPDFAEKIFHLIVREVVRRHEVIAQNKG